MLLIKHYVGKSSIHGLGVFSAEAVAGGARIWVFDPAIDIVIPRQDLNNLPDHVASRIRHCAEYYCDTDEFILGADGDSFMNHSNTPNLRNDGRSAYAARDIAAGEELTCDYRQTRVIGFDVQRSNSP